MKLQEPYQPFYGARLCAKHQPQRVGLPNACGRAACCGWSGRHSRAPDQNEKLAVIQFGGMPLSRANKPEVLWTVLLFRIAIPSAFFWPMSTTICLPRVIPV
jgi:hypothetical protein